MKTPRNPCCDHPPKFQDGSAVGSDPFWPRWDIDEWRVFNEAVEQQKSAALAGPIRQPSGTRKLGACSLGVLCEVTVVSHRDGIPGRPKSTHGETRFVGAEVETGRTYGFDTPPACYTQIILKFEIRLNLASAGRKWSEQNREAKQTRRDAGKSFGFDRLPLEFILIHEEQHFREACAALSAVANRFLACNTDGLSKEARKAIQDEWDRMTSDTGVNGETESRIRKATWDEWDRRHP